ncbi:MAG: PQQ-dependent dehydrogenase, methanol/ethanol family [candidate division NC10 bacterium]|nr:PQQ-dependent dehydrogenase, methanol/ethanol family [candidate division NC10 bacterium]
MRRSITGFRWIIFPLLAVFALPAFAAAQAEPIYVTDELLLNADKDPNNWFSYGRDYSSTRYSPLTQINTGNVKNLVPKWVFQFGYLDGQDSQANVNNGVLYITSSWNHVFALDARTGKTLWRYDHPLPEDVTKFLCCDVVNRGVAIYRDKVYIATLDEHVVALDAKTGKVVWDVAFEDYKAGYSATISPLPLRGKIIVGTAGAEYPTRLFIQAFDAETGASVWKTYTIPAPGEPGNETWGPGDAWKFGGASTWITGSYDPELNALYWPVGNPTPDLDGEVRPGDNLYSNSTLALDPDTGAIKFYFQYTPHDVWDYDGVNEVILVDIKGRKAWIHADRNGYFYAIDRMNGKFIYAVPLSPVNWALGLDPKTGRPIFNPEKSVYRDRVTKDISPSLEGGKEWHPMAYSPQTGYAYVPTFQCTTDMQAKFEEPKRGQLYLGAQVLAYHQGYGALKAIDVATGKTAWVWNNRSPMTSGVLATAGGVVFAGNPEGNFMAFDAKTGELLWKFFTGSGIVGNPTTYAVDGKQYVAIPVGWGGWTGWTTLGGGCAPWLKDTPKGGSLFVFGLHE